MSENRLVEIKLTGMASDYEAEQLKRQVVVQGRVKNMKCVNSSST